jgi:hypothetical protein
MNMIYVDSKQYIYNVLILNQTNYNKFFIIMFNCEIKFKFKFKFKFQVKFKFKIKIKIMFIIIFKLKLIKLIIYYIIIENKLD